MIIDKVIAVTDNTTQLAVKKRDLGLEIVLTHPFLYSE